MQKVSVNKNQTTTKMQWHILGEFVFFAALDRTKRTKQQVWKNPDRELTQEEVSHKIKII